LPILKNRLRPQTGDALAVTVVLVIRQLEWTAATLFTFQLIQFTTLPASSSVTVQLVVSHRRSTPPTGSLY